MLRHGRRVADLGTRRFPWREFKLIVKQQPAGSALARSLREGVEYTYTDALLVHVLNTLRVMSWQLGMDEDAPRPEPVLLPGQVAPTDDAGIDRMSIEEMDERLAPYMPRK